jgi:ATP-dependent Lon protease
MAEPIDDAPGDVNYTSTNDDIKWLKELPLLPLRDIVVYPGMVVPLFVGRPRSINALERAFESTGRLMMLAAQLDPGQDDPGPEDIYPVGCVAEISQVMRLPDGAVKALVEGKRRARITAFTEKGEYVCASITPEIATNVDDKAITTLDGAARQFFDRYIKMSQSLSPEEAASISAESDPNEFVNFAAAQLPLRLEERQVLLATTDVKLRLELLIENIQNEIEIQQIERRVRTRVKEQMDKSQREYYLNERMKAIQRELGRVGEGEKTEIEELKEKILSAGMPDGIEKKSLKELAKLESSNPMSSESAVLRNYIDWLVDVPWTARTDDKLDIKKAAEVLEEDHYGLEKVKDRILEYLAVRKLLNKPKGSVLCFVGPPGVGKTSLGRSIARAMGRKFVRFSLGGVHDEAEIRGHRRTYIGALPGRIIQAMKKAEVKNPVIMLDEIDKVGADFRGDPSAALLEALDPEQNVAFNDHYLEVDYDLSEVMFITTANTLFTIPRALRDRMEIIQIAGYTDQEKENIARQFLIPKQEKDHGLPEGFVHIPEKCLTRLVRNYTRESGVRNLEREIGSICRKIGRQLAEAMDDPNKEEQPKKITLTESRLIEYLGEIKYRDDVAETGEVIGVATGMAWTEVGGALLKVETSLLEGKGQFILTGKLGDVMKESARAALSYIRSRRKEFGLSERFHAKHDIHIHIPEGAIPKDGPSAGVTLITSMVSILTNTPVRPDVAMTGEITLRGQVLPIGGLKEKLLAASRGGITTVLIPVENQRDLSDIPDKIKKNLTIIPIATVEEALAYALVTKPAKARKKSIAKKGVAASRTNRKGSVAKKATVPDKATSKSKSSGRSKSVTSKKKNAAPAKKRAAKKAQG